MFSTPGDGDGYMGLSGAGVRDAAKIGPTHIVELISSCHFILFAEMLSFYTENGNRTTAKH